MSSLLFYNPLIFGYGLFSSGWDSIFILIIAICAIICTILEIIRFIKRK